MMKFKKFNPVVFAVNNIVPIIFFILCFGGIIASGLSLTFILNELVARLGRNLFIVISLIIPVVAGMGLNFALVIGAMAAQVGIIVIKILDIGGLLGVVITMIISTPLAIIFGILTGKVLNKTRGKEMITGLILGFFANGIYQLVFLVFIGTIIPVKNPEIILSSGVGIKNAVDLKFIQYSLDRFVENVIGNTLLSQTGIKYEIQVAIGGVTIPVLTLLICVGLAFFIKYIMKTKLGQDFRALGQDINVANVAGIKTERTRIIAITISTVLAAWGQVIFLQNIGTLNTYASHEQVGMFAVAALLVGGASVTKATIKDAVLGTILFHTMFIISPNAGKNIFGDALIGEYFRVFVAYGIIALSLALYAWKKKVEKDRSIALEEREVV